MALNLFKSISNWLAAAAATGMKVKIAVLAFMPSLLMNGSVSLHLPEKGASFGFCHLPFTRSE